MDLIVGDALALDVLINRAAMVLIVAEGIEQLGKREVWEPHEDFFRGDAELPQLGYCPHGRPRPGDDRGAVENLLGTDHVRMFRGGRHARRHSPGSFNAVSLLEEA